jgi:YidC/Oxa1 family membrane protein insertase
VNIFDTLVMQPIFNLLIGLYSIIPGGDFGISLILFTIIVRIVLFPLVKKQLHQTKAMKKLQPKLAQIKAETKGNKQLESARMMELYKEHGVNPFRSILVLIIQLPIFIALYQVIRIFTNHRDQIASFTYDFMEGIHPIRELIKHPDQFNEKLFGIVDLAQPALAHNQANIGILLVAVIAAIAQYYMSKQLIPQADSKKGLRQVMAEAAKGQSASQSDMNALISGKMTKIFPFIMLFIMLNLPGALVLYYAVSNLAAVVQQSYILGQDEEELEELADAAPAPTPKQTTKKRAKEAKQPNVTRITAKDTRKKEKK